MTGDKTALACGLLGASLLAATGCASETDLILSADDPVPALSVDGLTFRDLNKSGDLQPYEDWRLTADERADDLLAHMTLEEKAGAMMHGTLPGASGSEIGVSAEGYDLDLVRVSIGEKHITSFITRLSVDGRSLAAHHNGVQAIAAQGRLGIPLTISTDPRNHFQYVLGASAESKGFSQWPDALGFGAMDDTDQVRAFADIARQEYRAVGIHMALSPQADLATEPRWSRLTGTFGSNAELVSPLVQSYVAGFQNGSDGLAGGGVLTVVKHWTGYGAAPNGYDGHNYYGRFTEHDELSFAEHAAAFDSAFEAGVGGIMPAYTVLRDLSLDGEEIEQVAPGFSAQLLDKMLRETRGFTGIILSDWAITRDCNAGCLSPDAPHNFTEIAMPWGVENIAEAERFAKGIDAGIDQFGGVERPDIIVAATLSRRLDEARLDQSVLRIMRAKFVQGLFDRPFVDADEAASIVGRAEFLDAGEAAQRRSQILLENDDTLTLGEGTRVYLHNISEDAALARGLVPVDSPQEAELSLFRLTAPSEVLHPNHFFGSRQHEGRLDFRDGDEDYDALKMAASHGPVIASVYLDRPAILGNLQDKTAVLMGNFGANDGALIDVMIERGLAQGQLPFELPSSMEAVENQHPARADDSADPLYPLGAGILSN